MRTVWLTWCTNNNFYPTPSFEVNTWCTCTVYPDIHTCPSYNFWIRFYVNGGICVGVLEMKHANTVTFDVMTEFYSALCRVSFFLCFYSTPSYGKKLSFSYQKEAVSRLTVICTSGITECCIFFFLICETILAAPKDLISKVHVRVVVLWLGLCLYLRAVVLLSLWSL